VSYLKKVNTIRKKEIKAALKVLKSGNLSGFNAGYSPSFYGGKEVRQFEDKICNKFGTRNAIAVNSWTSGLIIAVASLDLPKGTEVICSSWGMSATVAAIVHSGLVPVFADIDTDTFSLTKQSIERKITNNTSAIIITEMYGYPSDIMPILDLADKYGLVTISDTAQTIGAKYHDRYAGTLTDIGGFSFNWNKHIHCGEGGVVITNNAELAQKMRLLRNHSEGTFHKVFPNFRNHMGYNFRMNEIEAAILSVSLDKTLKKDIKRRTRIVENFIDNLNPEVCSIPKPKKGINSVWCHCPILYKDTNTRDKVHQKLLNNNYSSNNTFSRGPLHLLPAFANYDGSNLVITESLDKTLLDFDLSFSYTKRELRKIIKILNNT